jgi:hypothetical protein
MRIIEQSAFFLLQPKGATQVLWAIGARLAAHGGTPYIEVLNRLRQQRSRAVA